MESNAGGMGAALEWIAEALYPDTRRPVAALVAEAADSPVGSQGILSSLGANVFNASHLELPVGSLTMSYMSAPRDRSRRRHLARAALEGMAYGVQANIEHLLGVAGID